MQFPAPLDRWRLPPGLLVTSVVAGVFGYCVLMAMVIVRQGIGPVQLLIAAWPLLVLSFIFVSRYFQWVVLAIPLLALMVPIEFPAGNFSRVPISLAAVLGLIVIWLLSLYWRGWRIAPSPLNRPLLVFSAICVLSLFWGIIWRDPILVEFDRFIIIQAGSLASMLASMGAALIVGNFVKTQGQLKYLVGCFIVCCSLMTVTQLFKIPQHILNDRGLWGLWLIAPLYGLLIAQPGLGWPKRALIIVLILLNLYQTMVVDSLWLSGWIPSLVAIAAITLLRSWKLFLIFAAVAAVLVYGGRGFFEEVAQDNVKEGGLERIEIWEQNWKVVKEHWLLGTGPAGYAIYYITYYRDTARSTHNNYLDILAQFGLVGSAIWIWLTVASLREGWSLSRNAPPGFLRTLAMIATGGWVASLVAMFFGDWILPFAYNQTISGYKYTVYSWLFLGALISIRQLISPHSQEVSA